MRALGEKAELVLVARVLAELRDQSARRRLPMVGQRPVTLTNREWQVLDLMRDGLTTKEMASMLFIESVTVRTHISSILRKLDVADRDAAIRLVGAPKQDAAAPPNGDARLPAGS